MRPLLCGYFVSMALAAHAQFMGGAGVAPGNAFGGGGYAAGVTVPRVNVAPFAGGYGGQGGFGFQTGAGRGIYGVTRRTFMGDANAVAATYFNSGGVRLPVQTGAYANQPGAVYLGRRQPMPAAVNRLATGTNPNKAAARQSLATHQSGSQCRQTQFGAGQPGPPALQPSQALSTWRSGRERSNCPPNTAVVSVTEHAGRARFMQPTMQAAPLTAK